MQVMTFVIGVSLNDPTYTFTILRQGQLSWGQKQNTKRLIIKNQEMDKMAKDFY